MYMYCFKNIETWQLYIIEYLISGGPRMQGPPGFNGPPNMQQQPPRFQGQPQWNGPPRPNGPGPNMGHMRPGPGGPPPQGPQGPPRPPMVSNSKILLYIFQ